MVPIILSIRSVKGMWSSRVERIRFITGVSFNESFVVLRENEIFDVPFERCCRLVLFMCGFVYRYARAAGVVVSDHGVPPRVRMADRLLLYGRVWKDDRRTIDVDAALPEYRHRDHRA